jgi:hypothetical protein
MGRTGGIKFGQQNQTQGDFCSGSFAGTLKTQAKKAKGKSKRNARRLPQPEINKSVNIPSAFKGNSAPYEQIELRAAEPDRGPTVMPPL